MLNGYTRKECRLLWKFPPPSSDILCHTNVVSGEFIRGAFDVADLLMLTAVPIFASVTVVEMYNFEAISRRFNIIKGNPASRC